VTCLFYLEFHLPPEGRVAVAQVFVLRKVHISPHAVPEWSRIFRTSIFPELVVLPVLPLPIFSVLPFSGVLFPLLVPKNFRTFDILSCPANFLPNILSKSKFLSDGDLRCFSESRRKFFVEGQVFVEGQIFSECRRKFFVEGQVFSECRRNFFLEGRIFSESRGNFFLEGRIFSESRINFFVESRIFSEGRQ